VLVHRSRAARRVLACGARFGKTLCAAHEAIAAMLEPRDRSIGWVVAPSYDLAERVFRVLVQIVETHLKHRIVEISAREMRIVITNFGGGVGEVRGKSADRPTSLLGEGLDWLVVDEAAQLDREVWESFLSQRLVDRKGWALFTSTPRGGGWFLSMYRRGQAGRDPEYESWSSPSAANPYLDPAAVEAERARLPDEVFRQEYEAEFIHAGDEPCDACGFPVPDAMGSAVLLVGEELPVCTECERPVDERGKCLMMLGPDGTAYPHIKCLILTRKLPMDPSDPGWCDSITDSEPRTMGEFLDVFAPPSMEGVTVWAWLGWKAA
jgi:Terminase large subunit, T4likevirus-type, N-terminal